MQTKQATPEQLKAALIFMKAIGDTIRDCGPAGCPSGVLYSGLMGRVSLHGYQTIIGHLKNAGLVRESGNVLYFIEEGK